MVKLLFSLYIYLLIFLIFPSCGGGTGGTSSSSNVFSPSGVILQKPTQVAIDSFGNIWVTEGNGLKEITSSAASAGFCSASTCLIFSSVGSTSFSNLSGIAIDISGNIWVSDSAKNNIVEIPSGKTPSNCGGCISIGGAFKNPSGIAVDNSGNIWVSNTGNNNVIEIPKNFTSTSCSTNCTLIGGFSQPSGIAVDGGNSVWVTNKGNDTIAKIPALTTNVQNGSCTNGCSISQPIGIAVDQSGNVWFTNSGNNTIVVLKGLAANTIQPIVSQTR